jgi:peptidoglycan L-alanyl-D-glutamate endopeptidase CwlK
MIHITKDPTLKTLLIQEALKARGLYDGKLDNWWGDKTDAGLANVVAQYSNDNFDARTEKNLSTLEPKAQILFRGFITEAKGIAAKHGCEYIGISGNRTFAEQDALYAKRPKVTNARGGQSNHNFGLAMDFGVFQGSNYLDNDNPKLAEKVHRAVSKIADKYSIEWGGSWDSFKDYPHFEAKSPLSMVHKRERVLAGQPILA